MKHFITLAAVLVATAAWGQTCDFRLSGHIEDADTRGKLVAAMVEIVETGQRLVTDQNGDFRFTGLCRGQYTLRVSHVNCETLERTVQLEKDQHLDLDLPHARKTLGEVVVEAQRGVVASGIKKELAGRSLEKTRGLSLAEALSQMNGVTMLQTGSNISKPVIHGLHGNRILTINNGVRQEGQQWGNEHAPEIDPFIADRLTVVKGVDELRYGSDAIGGVVLVDPRALRFKPGVMGEINAGFFTNNRQYVFSGQLEHTLKSAPWLAYRVQGTFRKGGNTATPGYRLNNTASEEKNFSATLGYNRNRLSAELFYSQFDTRIGIFTGSHIGNLTDLQNAINADRPADVFLGRFSYGFDRPYQDVTHQLLRLKSAYKLGDHTFRLLVAGQFNRRREFDIVRNLNNNRPQMDLSIYTFSEELNWEYQGKKGWKTSAGFTLMQQDNSYRGLYFIPNYFSWSYGAYLIEKWSARKWELQGGLRFDNKSIDTRRLKFNGDTLDYAFDFSTYAGSLNAVFKPSSHWKMNALVALSTRAPHVNELLSDGIHHGTATYERGDIFLRPEQALNFSAGFQYRNHSGRISADLVLYSNQIRNFIYQQPDPANPVLTIAGAFPLVLYKQTDASLNGLDLTFNWQLARSLQWTPKLSVLYARDKKKDDWLIFMPSNRYGNELEWRFRDGKKRTDTWLSIEAMHVSRQRRVPDESTGKLDYKAPPAAYTLVHLNGSATVEIFRTPVTFSLGLRNLFNTRYREYLNAMRYYTDEMGRNINLRLKVPLDFSTAQ